MPEINDPQQDLNNYTVDMKEMKNGLPMPPRL